MSRPESRAPAFQAQRIEQTVSAGRRLGVLMQRTDSADYQGRHVRVGGQDLLNFGGCSYLGLELREELKLAAIAAVRRYGTQLSFSRVYLECALYAELEDLLSQMTDGYALATPSTSLGHLAAFPVLIEAGDAVVIDRAAHASLHTAALLLRGVHIEDVPHGDASALEAQLTRLSKSARRVWYVLDGVYSMHGDLAPFAQLNALQAQLSNLHFYVDDAHATSWTGRHGRGLALTHLVDRSRLVVALSLNKAFSAAGGALIFHDAALRERVRTTGGPMLFSGPIQPPMLGAAVASAKLHLEARFDALQAALSERIQLATECATRLQLTLAASDPTPVFFARVGAITATFDAVRRMRNAGILVCAGAFPAVAFDQAGVRFTVSVHNAHADVVTLLNTLASAIAEAKACDEGQFAMLAAQVPANDQVGSGNRSDPRP